MLQKDAYTIDEFCSQNSISRRAYYKLKNLGIGPREMRVGKDARISREAAADWRREREQAAAASTTAKQTKAAGP